MLLDRICKQCGKKFIGGPRAYYCEFCRVERQAETNREHRARKRKGLTRKIGDNDKCERCGNEYEVKGGLQRFCEDCQRMHQLEHQRITNLAFYHLNKDKINPIRNIRRRIGLVTCRWCGNKFDAEHTCKVCCSNKCRRKYINKMWMEKSYPKRLNKNREAAQNDETI